MSQCDNFKVFTTFRVLKMNRLELNFLSIPTKGDSHVSTKGNLKIHYFMTSIYVQIGLPYMLTSEH